MKPYFNVCRYCGANLDPNEKCDCRKVPQKEKALPTSNPQCSNSCYAASVPIIQYGN